MTILFLISSEGHYGMENMLVVLARHLSILGCRCVIGVFRDSRFPHTEVADEAQKAGLAVEIIPCNGRVDWSAVRHIRSLLAKHDVDILHPHGYKADLYAYAAARRRNIHLVATSHNWPSKRLSMRAYAALDRLVLRRFHRVIAVSEPVKDTLLRSQGTPDKISMVPNGVDIDLYRAAMPTLKKEAAFAPTRPLIGFVGRFVPDKGGALLIHAAKQVVKVDPDALFVFVGDGPSRDEWQALAQNLGIADHFVFVGVRNDMPGVYASLDMLVLPSLVESMPMCLLEGMAAGKPVIATRLGAVPKLIIPDRTGILLDPGDVDQLAEAILRLRMNPDLARRLGMNGHAHVSQHYSAESMARNYIEQYDHVMGCRGTDLEIGASISA